MAFASYVFNGTDEYLFRTLSTSGASTTRFTYSFWAKIDSFGANGAEVYQVINAPTNTQIIYSGVGSALFNFVQDGADAWDVGVSGLTNATATWDHWLMSYDSTNATAADRIKMYKNGVLLTDTGVNPDLNEAHYLFQNGYQHQIGGWVDLSRFMDGKLAFIEVVEGQALDPTSFAFDNGGTWARRRYTGSYGTHGFSLDGSDGFNDVSGNSQHFTGQNMTTGANLDGADLPPHAVDAELSSAGVATATAIASTLADSVANASGTATATAVGEAVTTLDAVFSASGSATVSGVASALADSAATSSGTSSAEAAGDSENPVDTPEETPVIVSAGGGGTMASPEITIRDLKKIQKRRPRTHIIKIGEWPDEEAERKRREAELFPTIDLEPLLLNMPEADDEDEEALIALLAMVA